MSDKILEQEFNITEHQLVCIILLDRMISLEYPELRSDANTTGILAILNKINKFCNITGSASNKWIRKQWREAGLNLPKSSHIQWNEPVIDKEKNTFKFSIIGGGCQYLPPLPDNALIVKGDLSDPITSMLQSSTKMMQESEPSVLDWYERKKHGRAADIPKLPTLKSAKYVTNSGQEFFALGEAASNGQTRENWRNDEQDKKRVYNRKGLHHRVRLGVLPKEESEIPEMGTALLEKLTDKQNADCFFALLYISDLLVEPGRGWIELNDIAKKIGRNVNTKENAAQARRDVYEYLKFGERAEVIGERSITYKDKTTGKTIPTRIEAPLWKMLDRQMPIQPSLLSDIEYRDVPVAVHVALSEQWRTILRHPDILQFLPHGELLGGIPGKQPSGAYARVMGLMLFYYWRRESAKTLLGICHQTRRELLMTMNPTVSPAMEILESDHPGYVIDYYYNGLGILVEKGIVAPEGDAAPHKDRREGLPEQGWQDDWLDTIPQIYPGEAIRPSLEIIAKNKYIEKPKSLAKKPGRKPKTNTATE